MKAAIGREGMPWMIGVQGLQEWREDGGGKQVGCSWMSGGKSRLRAEKEKRIREHDAYADTCIDAA